MLNHQALVKEITQELFADEKVLTLILYGSVSRSEENANSDIDLLAIISDNYMQKRHEIRKGITVEYVEMHLNYLQDFVSKREMPMIFALADGVVLFDKNTTAEQLIVESKKVIEEGAPENTKWNNEAYRIKKRSDLTEIYKDLLDVDDEVEFNYIVNLLITALIPIIIENNKLWLQTRKKTIDYLKSQCFESYKYLEVLLKSTYSLQEKRIAAEGLTEYALKPYGGILKGEAVIFRKDNI